MRKSDLYLGDLSLTPIPELKRLQEECLLADDHEDEWNDEELRERYYQLQGKNLLYRAEVLFNSNSRKLCDTVQIRMPYRFAEVAKS